jgi:hypothetical protein
VEPLQLAEPDGEVAFRCHGPGLYQVPPPRRPPRQPEVRGRLRAVKRAVFPRFHTARSPSQGIHARSLVEQDPKHEPAARQPHGLGEGAR